MPPPMNIKMIKSPIKIENQMTRGTSIFDIVRRIKKVVAIYGSFVKMYCIVVESFVGVLTC